uniref:Uncharacterized protein n=1 Tax=Pelusios castaneus TaxID=367368 RepID=A0A8C8S1X0_9SAUR
MQSSEGFGFCLFFCFGFWFFFTVQVFVIKNYTLDTLYYETVEKHPKTISNELKLVFCYCLTHLFSSPFKLSKKYGPVFSIQLGRQKVVVLSGYEVVKEAFVNQADVFAERLKVSPFTSGVTFSHGKNCKVMQRFTLMTLRDFGMGRRAIEDQIVEESRFLIKDSESQKGKPFEITTVFSAAVVNIIVTIIFGERFDYKDFTFLRLRKKSVTEMGNEPTSLLDLSVVP